VIQEVTTLGQTSLVPVLNGDSRFYSVSVCAVVCALKGYLRRIHNDNSPAMQLSQMRILQ